MFWTIVGALAFFFIGLPIIFAIVAERGFWVFLLWLIGMLFGMSGVVVAVSTGNELGATLTAFGILFCYGGYRLSQSVRA